MRVIPATKHGKIKIEKLRKIHSFSSWNYGFPSNSSNSLNFLVKIQVALILTFFMWF